MPAYPEKEGAFWLVWSPTGHTPPTIRYSDEAPAIAEAERLARANPGSTFYVVMATHVSVVVPPTITTRLKPDSIPY